MKSSLLILLLLFCCRAVAQEPCAAPRIDTAALRRAAANPDAGRGVNYAIRLYFHIVKNNDGSNAAISMQELQAEFQQLQLDYAANNICFLFMGVDSVYNSSLNTALSTSDAIMMSTLQSYNVPGCINIFYLWNFPGAGGTSFAIPNDFCVISRPSLHTIAGTNTTAHEIGHCLGLMHTFETAVGVETINRSNCSSAGDQVCDTPADPQSYSGLPCFLESNCTYLGYCADPNGAFNFTPPYNNIMSYWRCTAAPNVFTGGQFNRINSFLFTTPELAATLSVSSDNYSAATVSSGTVMKSAIQLLTVTGNVQLSGSVRASLQARTVVINPTYFRANPSGGKIIIRPADCNY